MFIDFYGSTLEHDETVFTPTTVTKLTAANVPVDGKKVLDLGCGIGPLAIYYAKNGADSVTAADIYDRHVEYTKWNAIRNDVDIEVIQSDLFDNIEEKFDVISCDVSGIPLTVAEISGWFPDGVPIADESGMDIICRAIEDAPKYLNTGGAFYVCISQLSDFKKIKDLMDKNNASMIFDKDIPFSKELAKNVGKLKPEHYNKRGSRYTWNFSLWKMEVK
jgi:methylase of polypeptide subunit release factors